MVLCEQCKNERKENEATKEVEVLEGLFIKLCNDCLDEWCEGLNRNEMEQWIFDLKTK